MPHQNGGPAGANQRRNLRILLRLLLGTVILAVIVRAVGVTTVVDTLRGVAWAPLALSALLLIVAFVLSSVGLIVLFPRFPSRDRLGAVAGFLRVTSITLVLPGRLGDIAFAGAYAPWGNPGVILARVLAHRLLSMVYLTLIAFFGGLWVVGRQDWLWAVVLIVLAGIGVLVGIIRSRTVRSFIKRRILRRYAGSFEGFYAAFQASFPGRPRTTALHCAVSMVRFAVAAISTMMVFQACGLTIDWHVTLVGNAINALIGAVPVTLLGLGVSEIVGVGFYGLFGLGAGAVVAVMLVGRLRSVVVLGLFALLWLWPDRGADRQRTEAG